MKDWFKRWLRGPPENTTVEEQLELPFDPPLPRYKPVSNKRLTPTRQSQENV